MILCVPARATDPGELSASNLPPKQMLRCAPGVQRITNPPPSSPLPSRRRAVGSPTGMRSGGPRTTIGQPHNHCSEASPGTPMNARGDIGGGGRESAGNPNIQLSSPPGRPEGPFESNRESNGVHQSRSRSMSSCASSTAPSGASWPITENPATSVPVPMKRRYRASRRCVRVARPSRLRISTMRYNSITWKSCSEGSPFGPRSAPS